MANFLWGSAGQKMSPAQVAEQRKIAQALMAEASDTSSVGHWTAALNRGLQGWLGGRQAYQAREAEAAGRAGYEAKKAGMANAVTLGGGDPVAAALSGGAGGERFNGDLASGISETASTLGMDPVDLATIISYETAGTFDPTKAGPTTQWGQHRGLIQFGEPQALSYGVDWDDPLGSQLGANGAIANYFSKNGWKPGMGLLDAYSIVNAGAPGRYNASDANNGGAPGTVADKVNNQMSGHRQKAINLFGGGYPSNNTSNIAALLSDEWAPESERAVLQAQMQQAQQQENAIMQAQLQRQQSDYEYARGQSDPMRQMELQKAELELNALRNPAAPKPIEVGGVLLDPNTYKPIFDSRDPATAKPPEVKEFYDESTGQPYMAQWDSNGLEWKRIGGTKAADPYTLGVGQERYDANGNITARGPSKEYVLDDYEKYQRETKNAGGTPLDRLQYAQAIKGNGITMTQPDGTTITIGGKGGDGKGPEFKDTGAFRLDTVLGDIDDLRGRDLGDVTGIFAGAGGNDVDALGWKQRVLLGEEGLATVERLGNLQNKTWMAAREMLKGGGAITDYESKKAEGAMARLSRAKSEKELRIALTDLRDAVVEGQKKLTAAGVNTPSQPQAIPQPKTKAEFDALPSGATFIAPDGTTRSKP